MKVKEILNMEAKDLERIMTEEEFERMQDLGIEYVWQLLDMLQDSAKQSGQNEDEEHITISAYLDYLQEMRNSSDEI